MYRTTYISFFCTLLWNVKRLFSLSLLFSPFERFHHKYGIYSFLCLSIRFYHIYCTLQRIYDWIALHWVFRFFLSISYWAFSMQCMECMETYEYISFYQKMIFLFFYWSCIYSAHCTSLTVQLLCMLLTKIFIRNHSTITLLSIFWFWEEEKTTI